jgi:hypothetical protein
VSSELKKKTTKFSNSNEPQLVDTHDTKVKEIGTTRRNITRKKGGNENSFNSKNKKHGGAG